MHSWEMKSIPFFELPPFLWYPLFLKSFIPLSLRIFFLSTFQTIFAYVAEYLADYVKWYTDNYLKFKYFTTFLNVSLPQTKNYWFWLTSPKNLPSPPFLHPSFLLSSHFRKIVIPPFDTFENCYPLFWRGVGPTMPCIGISVDKQRHACL